MEQLDILIGQLQTASSIHGWPDKPLPIVALDADERLAVATVLNRGTRLPLPTEAASRLAALGTWLAPLLDQDRLLLEPAAPG